MRKIFFVLIFVWVSDVNGNNSRLLGFGQASAAPAFGATGFGTNTSSTSAPQFGFGTQTTSSTGFGAQGAQPSAFGSGFTGFGGAPGI